MIIPLSDERALVMRRRIESWRKENVASDAVARAMAARFATPWRSSGILAQVVGFALTALAVAFAGMFFDQIVDTPLLAGLSALALGEWLVRGKKWWSTGVEGALWVGGLFNLIFALPGESKPEALLLFASSCIAGWIRLRQPWCGALAAVFVLTYFSEKNLEPLALVGGIAIGVAALLLLHRTWNRPSSEWLLIALLLTGPPAGYLVAVEIFPPIVTAALFIILGALFLGAALRLRQHAPFAAAAIAFVIAGAELHDLLPFPTEAKLAVAGALLLGCAAIASRALHGRTTGLVSTAPARTEADELLDAGGAVAAVPEQPAAVSDDRPPGDGGFGGAGATGSF